MNVEQVRKLAQDEGNSPANLAMLSSSSDKLVRRYVASNPNTPLKTLEKLVQEFPKQVYNHPAIAEVLTGKQQVSLQFRIEIARAEAKINSLDSLESCEDSKVWALAIDALPAEEQIRQAKDETTPPKILKELAYSIEKQVRAEVAGNPNTPIDFLVSSSAEFPEAVTSNPIFELLKLENPESESIQVIEARSTATSPKRLLVLAGSTYRNVVLALVENSATPHEALMRLIDNPRRPLSPFYKSIIDHPNSSIAVMESFIEKRLHGSLQNIAISMRSLARLLGKTQKYQQITENPRLSPLISNTVGILTKDKAVTPEILMAYAQIHYLSPLGKYVFRHPNMTPELLDRLSLSEIELIKTAVAKHYKTSIATLKRLAQDENKFVRTAILERRIGIVPQEIAAILAQDPVESVRVGVAAAKKIAPEVIAILARDSSNSVRVAVTKIQKLDSEVIALLAQDSSESVRCSLVQHHYKAIALILPVLDRLAQDNSETVRAKVAYWLPSPDLIETFAFDPSPLVRGALVGGNVQTHPGKFYLSLELLRRMLKQSESFLSLANRDSSLLEQEVIYSIEQASIKHPDISLNVLLSSVQHQDEKIRAAAASNPKLPVEILDRLMGDKSQSVRRAVTYNPSVSSDTLKKGAKIYYARPSYPGKSLDIAFQVLRQRKKAALWGMAFLIYEKSFKLNPSTTTSKIFLRLNVVWVRL